MALTDKSALLYGQLSDLYRELRTETFEKHHRMNPFTEDLVDWKERGSFWAGEGKNITIYNSTILIGDVEIGKETWIGPFCSLDGGGGLRIGEYCSISAGCQIVSHDSVKWALSGGQCKYDYASVEIGNCCFIGTNSVITKGVRIGNNCLIAACSVVTKDVPPFTIVGGVPAKKIGTVVLREDNSVELLFDKK